MDLGTFPAITKIALGIIKANQSAIIDQAITFWCFIIVFVDLWQAIGEFKFLMIDRMTERQLYKIQFRKYFFHLQTDELIHPVIITDMQKSSRDQILANVICFLHIKDHIAMSRHMHKRIIED